MEVAVWKSGLAEQAAAHASLSLSKATSEELRFFSIPLFEEDDDTGDGFALRAVLGLRAPPRRWIAGERLSAPDAPGESGTESAVGFGHLASLAGVVNIFNFFRGASWRCAFAPKVLDLAIFPVERLCFARGTRRRFLDESEL